MPPSNDQWYIRFPDGRVLRATGTTVIRQHLAAGCLPPGTYLRRSLEEEWRRIDRYPEFADLSPSSTEFPSNGVHDRHTQVTIASRLDPAQLRLVGVRGYVEELLAALDATVVRCKIQVAFLAGILLAGLVTLARWPIFSFSLDPVGWGWSLAGAALVVLGWLAGVLSRTTYVELSRLRPSRWRDGLTGAGTLTARLAVAYALVGGLVGGFVAVLRWLPGWCQLQAEASDERTWAIAGQVLAVAAVPGEVMLWLLLVLLLPVGALLVVEECSVLSGLWQWVRLVRKSPGRLLVAEGLAIAMAFGLALPLIALLVVLKTWSPERVHVGLVEGTRLVIVGVLLALPVAYLLVANVFIYLNLRYELPRQ